MDLDQMAYRCPKAEVVEIVRLEGYRLTFAAAGSGLATIFPEQNQIPTEPILKAARKPPVPGKTQKSQPKKQRKAGQER